MEGADEGEAEAEDCHPCTILVPAADGPPAPVDAFAAYGEDEGIAGEETLETMHESGTRWRTCIIVLDLVG